MNPEQTIKNFIIENYIIDDTPEPLNHAQSFLESGIIDSTGMLELVSFIEGTFDIKIEDEELIPDNLDSINKITTFICKKKKD